MDNDTNTTFETQRQAEAADTSEFPATASSPLPAYAPPLVAHHPEPRLKGRWWAVAAAALLGIVVAAGAWTRSSRVSSVGLLGVQRPAQEQVVAPAPRPEPLAEEALPAEPEASTPRAATPEGGKIGGLVGSPSSEEPPAPAAEGQGETFGFSWPDENGGTWGYEYTIPSDPESTDESYSLTWPDEQDPSRNHEFRYRREGDSYTFEYDGEEFSLDLEDLEWLFGGEQPDGWNYWEGWGDGGYGAGHGPGHGQGLGGAESSWT